MKKYVGKTKHKHPKSLFGDEPYIEKNKNEKFVLLLSTNY